MSGTDNLIITKRAILLIVSTWSLVFTYNSFDVGYLNPKKGIFLINQTIQTNENVYVVKFSSSSSLALIISSSSSIKMNMVSVFKMTLKWDIIIKVPITTMKIDSMNSLDEVAVCRRYMTSVMNDRMASINRNVCRLLNGCTSLSKPINAKFVCTVCKIFIVFDFILMFWKRRKTNNWQSFYDRSLAPIIEYCCCKFLQSTFYRKQNWGQLRILRRMYRPISMNNKILFQLWVNCSKKFSSIKNVSMNNLEHMLLIVDSCLWTVYVKCEIKLISFQNVK